MGREETLKTSIKIQSIVYSPASLSLLILPNANRLWEKEKGEFLVHFKALSTPLQPHPMNGPFKKEINFPKTQILLQMLGYK